MEANRMLQTLDGNDVELTTRGILYLCDLSDNGLQVIKSVQFESAFDALNAYSNIPNPESQLITGKDYDDLIKNMHSLHGMMQKESWLEMLRESI